MEIDLFDRKLTIELTKVQESALLQFAVIRIIEDRLEHEVDKYIARQEGAKKQT